MKKNTDFNYVEFNGFTLRLDKIVAIEEHQTRLDKTVLHVEGSTTTFVVDEHPTVARGFILEAITENKRLHTLDDYKNWRKNANLDM